MHIYTCIIYIVSTTGTDIPSAKGNALAHAHKTTGLSTDRAHNLKNAVLQGSGALDR